MQDKLLSIIVPAYNTEKYIEECIKSIQAQTYKNIEIVIVNDGSVDKTGVLCEKLALEDKRIKYISQKNAGVTKARAKGVDAARGDFVAFVDSDDYLEPEMYKGMMAKILDYDIVSSGFVHHPSDDRINYIFNDFEGAYSTKSEIEQVWNRMIYDVQKDKLDSLMPCLVCKIYKRELAKKILEKMDANIFYAEDATFLYQYILECKSAYFLKEAFYHYRYREDSVCHSKNEQMLMNVNCMYNELKSIFNQHYMKEELNIQLQKRAVVMTLNALNQYMGFSAEYRVPQYIISVDNLVDKRIVVYGASQMGQDVMFLLKKRNLTPIAWMDKDCKYYKNQGLDVCSPSLLKELEFDVLLIAVSDMKLANSIKAELLDKGVSEEKMLWKSPMKLY